LSSIYGTSGYDDYLRGYFFAPVDGSYIFETTVDDVIVIYMSTVQNSANPANMAVLIRVNTYMYYPEDPYNFLNNNNVATVNLKKGYYYMEIISRDYGGSHFYYVSVSMPPMDISTISTIPITSATPSYIKNPTWKIENIIIVPTNILPEIITVTVDSTKFASSTAKFILYYFVSSNGAFTQVSSSAIAIGATAAQFQSAIGGLGQFTGYGLTVTLTMLDSTGASTTIAADAVKYAYQLTYQNTRPSSYTKLPYTNNTAVTAVTTQAHSPGMGGTYTFSLGGVPLSVYDSTFGKASTQIQITNSIGYLQSALRTYYNAPEL
jgi:hypothetical protein